MRHLSSVELLSLDAATLQTKLESGAITSAELVEQYLAQIEKHDKQGLSVNALIAITPRQLLLTKAAELDKERSEGKVRSKLHGIPILVKDAFITAPETGLPTTIGSFAFDDAKPARSARVIEKLESMGVILLGKTNMNELIGLKGFAPANGWSAVGGQTRSAYIAFAKSDGDMGQSNPCGSSTGSAVSVSAGFAPLAIGTETVGSVVQPGNRAGLFAMKPTVKSTLLDGVWPGTPNFDAIGGLTKSVLDLAVITASLLTPERAESLPANGFETYLTKSFNGLRIGFLDQKIWTFPPDVLASTPETIAQMSEAYTAIMDLIKHQEGTKVLYPVQIPEVKDLDYKGELGILAVIFYEMRDNIANFLERFNTTNVRSLEDLVQFNKDHAEKELPSDHPDQDWLVKGLESRPTKEHYEAALAHIRNTAGENGIARLFAEEDLNLLAFPMDSGIAMIAAAAGYPIATMPLGALLWNGRPFSLGIMALPGREDLMFQFMSAFEASVEPRPLPPLLVEHNAELEMPSKR